MKRIRFSTRFFSIFPLLLFTTMLIGLLLIRLMFNMVLPWWGAWGLGICWAIMAFDYLVRAELFKQIGGFAVTLIAALILTGALIPQEQVSRYPRMASDQLVREVETAWNAVYTGDIFKNYSPKQSLINYGTSLGDLDPFRHGKMILFGLLGFALAVVYLFPIEPAGALKRGKGRSSKRPDGLVKTRQSRSLKSSNLSADFNVFNESRERYFNEPFGRLNAGSSDQHLGAVAFALPERGVAGD